MFVQLSPSPPHLQNSIFCPVLHRFHFSLFDGDVPVLHKLHFSLFDGDVSRPT